MKLGSVIFLFHFILGPSSFCSGDKGSGGSNVHQRKVGGEGCKKGVGGRDGVRVGMVSPAWSGRMRRATEWKLELCDCIEGQTVRCVLSQRPGSPGLAEEITVPYVWYNRRGSSSVLCL